MIELNLPPYPLAPIDTDFAYTEEELRERYSSPPLEFDPEKIDRIFSEGLIGEKEELWRQKKPKWGVPAPVEDVIGFTGQQVFDFEKKHFSVSPQKLTKEEPQPRKGIKGSLREWIIYHHEIGTITVNENKKADYEKKKLLATAIEKRIVVTENSRGTHYYSIEAFSREWQAARNKIYGLV